MCKTFGPPYQCMQHYVLDGNLRHGCVVNSIPKKIKARPMRSDLIYAVQPDSKNVYM